MWTFCRTSNRFVLAFVLLMPCPLFAASRPVLVCFGDSITAGYGLQPGQSYPDALQRKLDRAGYPYKVTIRAPAAPPPRMPSPTCASILHLHPEVVIVEFGGNDGLRGLPPDQTRRNLDTVLTTLENAHIKVLLAGITLPPNYGPDYIHAFESIFRDLAAKHHTAFVPMIYKDLVNVPDTIQADGIHPTAKGSEIIADTLLPALKPLLHKAVADYSPRSLSANTHPSPPPAETAFPQRASRSPPVPAVPQTPSPAAPRKLRQIRLRAVAQPAQRHRIAGHRRHLRQQAARMHTQRLQRLDIPGEAIPVPPACAHHPA